MKKGMLILLSVCILSGIFVGCGKQEQDADGILFEQGEKLDITLLENLALENGYIWLFRYQDGQVINWRFYEPEMAQELVNYINSRTVHAAENVDLSEAGGPVYGMWFSHNDVGHRDFAWVDGCWIDENGATYQVDIDFEKILEEYPWKDESTSISLVGFPAIYQLACLGGEWNPSYMAESGDLKSNGLELEITSIEEKVLTVNLINPTKRSIPYGETYEIQVELDGKWYKVPPENDGMAFAMIGYAVSAGSVDEKTYDLRQWAPLPEGYYRIVVEGATAEFNWPGDMPE